ncbi:MAG: hypothetical protein IT297_00410 [Anaerolineae bacterium]|nr:hypothetical protein [Anaerolineae bacterium]
MKKISIATTTLILLILVTANALAQSYLFELDRMVVDVYLNSDGTTSIQYQFTFTNQPGAARIEYVDIGMPNSDFSLAGAAAEANGKSVALSRSDYEGDGSGFAVSLGGAAIPPGQTGTVKVFIPNAGSWLRYDDKDKSYASFVFSPTWFGSKYVQGTTDIQMTFHLPPGVKAEEPRWHDAPSGFPAEPQTGFDDQGRVTYTWENTQASGSRQYEFGASFPASYVPVAAVQRTSIFERLGINEDNCFSFICCGSVIALIVGSSWFTNIASRRRKLQYLPPKISIEGMGIKRGLTAVEAATLMEEPLDKVMTMILFSVIKKGAAAVRRREPLELDIADPLPEGLNPYETDFLKAFQEEKKERRAALQTMMIGLVNSVSNKMKGFSRKETIAYYRDIIERAWKQVETAQTPEIKSETYDKYLEWTMLDKDYDGRTREVFRTGPVFVPTWWGHYDPSYPRPASGSKPLASPTQTAGGQGGQFTLPTLPGGAFAASMVKGVQDFSSSVIGNVTDFTSTITNKTNPAPVTTSTGGSSGGHSGGSSCACACACAGCACACAGGGR